MKENLIQHCLPEHKICILASEIQIMHLVGGEKKASERKQQSKRRKTVLSKLSRKSDH